MPVTPSTLADGKPVSDFKISFKLFNSHFTAQCNPFKNVIVLLECKHKTDKSFKNSFNTLECQIEGEGGINEEAGKFRPK